MTRRSRKVALAAVAIATAAIAIFAITRPRAEWIREHPLTGAAEVVAVADGAFTLADGRVFIPAGIRWRDGIGPVERDAALSVATAQGAIIIRDFGDGRAMAVVEPRFYNWCGTCRRRGFLGAYAKTPLSEILIYTGYALPDTNHPNLTALEQWRLEGALQIRPQPDAEPRRISETKSAFRYESGERMFHMYDFVVETTWKPPPDDDSAG